MFGGTNGLLLGDGVGTNDHTEVGAVGPNVTGFGGIQSPGSILDLVAYSFPFGIYSKWRCVEPETPIIVWFAAIDTESPIVCMYIVVQKQMYIKQQKSEIIECAV